MPYKDKESLYAAQKKHRDRNKAKLLEYLADHPCVDCGNSDSRVLEFDHLHDKKFNIARMVSGGHFSWTRIQEEISKCQVRCANCHRIKTLDQFGWSR